MQDISNATGSHGLYILVSSFHSSVEEARAYHGEVRPLVTGYAVPDANLVPRGDPLDLGNDIVQAQASVLIVGFRAASFRERCRAPTPRRRSSNVRRPLGIDGTHSRTRGRNKTVDGIPEREEGRLVVLGGRLVAGAGAGHGGGPGYHLMACGGHTGGGSRSSGRRASSLETK